MRSCMAGILLLCSFGALAQEATQYPCSPCRDVRIHPQDFGNHAFNEAFLKSSSLLPTFSISALVVNGEGQWGLVYLSRVMVSSGLMIGFYPGISYQVPYPSPFVQISVQDPWGRLTSYTVLADSAPLVVGDAELVPLAPESESESETTDPYLPDKHSGGTELLGGYDASANYYGGATYPYYDIRLIND